MKIKSIKEQLIDMGLKHGDRINVKGTQQNPFTIDFRYNCLRTGNDEYRLEDLAGYEFEKVVPTKEELIEELKKRSKKFEKGESNYRIVYDFELQMVIWSVTCSWLSPTALYFDEETAEKICEELNADREKVKILFDLEE